VVSRHLTAPEAAEQRRSIRQYTADSIPDDELREILRLAGRAPSAWNLQPWRFVVVREAALKQQLMAAANNQPQVGGAPAVIVLYSDMDDVLAHLDELVATDKAAAFIERITKHFGAMSPADRAAWGHGMAYIALGWLLLIAQSRGYTTSPMLGFDATKVKTLLDLPPTSTVAALVALGLPNEEGALSRRLPVDRTTSFR
jgi:nitroreductase